MVLIPNQKNIKNMIDAVDVTEPQRGYLGMSAIGDSCERKLWYSFRFFTKERTLEKRVKRIFETGHIAENFIINDLKGIGCEVYRWVGGQKVELFGHKEEEQDQCSDIADHFKGHTDGEIIGLPEDPETPHLLEMKTHNDKSFKDLVKNGVKKSKPMHFSQMQIYMHYRKLSKALYVAYNKNDSDYYFEIVDASWQMAEDLIRKADFIIKAEHPPAKTFPKTWFECKWCSFKEHCHGEQEPDKTCRTCSHSDICDDGKWECSLKTKVLTIEEQLEGCEKYKKVQGI